MHTHTQVNISKLLIYAFYIRILFSTIFNLKHFQFQKSLPSVGENVLEGVTHTDNNNSSPQGSSRAGTTVIPPLPPRASAYPDIPPLPSGKFLSRTVQPSRPDGSNPPPIPKRTSVCKPGLMSPTSPLNSMKPGTLFPSGDSKQSPTSPFGEKKGDKSPNYTKM